MKTFYTQGACSPEGSVKRHRCPIFNAAKIFIQGRRHLRKGLKSFKGQEALELDRRKANLPRGENIQLVVNLICQPLWQGIMQALGKHSLGVSERMFQTQPLLE